jgi:hypothetical protein
LRKYAEAKLNKSADDVDAALQQQLDDAVAAGRTDAVERIKARQRARARGQARAKEDEGTGGAKARAPA